jgi:tetratricopeptide (TPR) repeat protein
LRKAIELDPNFENTFELANLLEIKGNPAESVALYESVLNSDFLNSPEHAPHANATAWRCYILGSNLTRAEEAALKSLQHADSLATLQTVFAIQARAGRWDAADSYFRRYVREYPIADIVGRAWKDDILFFRDAVAAGKQKWVADRIIAELPVPRDDRWEIIRLALIGEPVDRERVRNAVQIVAGQFSSDDPAPTFPELSPGT